MKPRYVHQIPEVQSPFRSYCLQFSPCAKYLACGSDGIVVILQVERGMMKELLRIDLVQSHSAIFSPGEQILSICWIRSPITGGLGNLLCGTQSGLIVLVRCLSTPWPSHNTQLIFRFLPALRILFYHPGGHMMVL
jgi:hypothetical protein